MACPGIISLPRYLPDRRPEKSDLLSQFGGAGQPDKPNSSIVRRYCEKPTMEKRKLLSQNFFKDPALVSTIVSDASLGRNDIVVEIGPGNGIITRELAKVCHKVVAIEKASHLCRQLKVDFKDMPNVELHNKDFLRFEIRYPRYKVFSNIPYGITADTVNKLLYGKNPPIEAFLVMQKEAAQKFCGAPRETEYAVLIKPWFALDIIREFRRTDFVPVPNVDSLLLRIKKRDHPLVSEENANLYRWFVRYGFEAWKKSLKIAFKPIFTYAQWKRLSRDLHFPLKATPRQLIFEQWLGLFEYFLLGVPDSKKMIMMNEWQPVIDLSERRPHS